MYWWPSGPRYDIGALMIPDPRVHRPEPAVNGAVERDVTCRDQCAAVREERLFDAPHLATRGGVERNELAVVATRAGVARHVRAPVRRSRDVAGNVSLVVHADVLRRHVEESRARRERRRLEVL